jgi:protein-disulfide isomerase
MNTKLISAIALVGALGAGGWWYSTQTNGPAPMEAAAQVGTTEVHPLDMVLGNPEASVVMVEYSSLTCPHCATYNAGAFQQIKENFIETGQVFYIKREVYFDRYGLWAAMVARCGGEARYHGMIELIYQTQSTWAASSDPMQVANNLRRLGRQAGMNDTEINACLEDSDMALALTEFYQQNAETYGIRSTPSFVIDGQLYSNMAYAEFERILNEKLGS